MVILELRVQANDRDPMARSCNSSSIGHNGLDILKACISKSSVSRLSYNVGLENAVDKSFKGQAKVPGLRRMPRLKIAHKGASSRCIRDGSLMQEINCEGIIFERFVPLETH